MYENFKMSNMTWQEFAKKKDDVIILPIGATEQHGPHLPTCVDAVLAEGFAYRIAEKTNGVIFISKYQFDSFNILLKIFHPLALMSD